MMQPGTGASATPEQIASLRETILEAEDICRAIRHGEVDAVVAGKDDEEKHVLLMSGAFIRYRQIVEDMTQGAVTLAASGEILFANQAFARMLAESPADVFQTPVWDWIAAADHDKLKALIAGGDGSRQFNISLVRRDEDPLVVRASLVTGSDDFLTLILTELSDRQADADAAATLEAIRNGTVDAFVVNDKQVMILDSARSPYRALAERMRQGAVTIDANGVIVFANERFASQVGLPHGRILGARLLDFIAEGTRAAYRAMLAGKDGAHDEITLCAWNGARLATQATITSVEDHKLFLFADLTEQKRHQAFDELTRKFLGMMAHEFRNILSPISTSSALLKKQTGLDAEGKKAIGTIERNVERLLALVEDLRRINPRD